MNFVFTLEAGNNAGELAYGNGEYVCRVPIGFDSDGDDVFSLFAALSPYPGGGAGEYEFVFSLVRSDAEGQEIDWYWDGLQTSFFLTSAEQRRLVFIELCEMLYVLIEASQASRIVMTTHTAHLPRKALIKFQKLVVAMRKQGFDARKVDPAHGNHMWISIR